uniref:Uncharacterized protein n=1 Tax=Gopherus evgoodei TaxID=1825980 RepID=A0A8C4Y2L0_9SAUR
MGLNCSKGDLGWTLGKTFTSWQNLLSHIPLKPWLPKEPTSPLSPFSPGFPFWPNIPLKPPIPGEPLAPLKKWGREI